jgi:hypothetical protein
MQKRTQKEPVIRKQTTEREKEISGAVLFKSGVRGEWSAFRHELESDKTHEFASHFEKRLREHLVTSLF